MPVTEPLFIFQVPVKDPIVYSIYGKRSHSEQMKCICLLFFNEVLDVLLQLSEL